MLHKALKSQSATRKIASANRELFHTFDIPLINHHSSDSILNSDEILRLVSIIITPLSPSESHFYLSHQQLKF